MFRMYMTTVLIVMAFAGAAPAQNSCSAPVIMAGNTANFDTTAATTDGPTETLCNFSSDNQVGKDVWYRWTAPCPGSVTAEVCTSTFDTKLAVYSTCPAGPNTAIACNDDFCGTRSSITFTAVGGTSYLFRIGGFNNGSGPAFGTGTLNVNPPSCPPPVNDVCVNATVIGAYGAFAFNNFGATTSGPAPTTCGSGNNIGADIWYSFTTCVAGSHTIDTCTGGNFDSVILVYAGPCNTFAQVACNDDACGAAGRSSLATWTATANTLYYIRVGGFQGAVGSGTLTLAGPACPGPSNDNCINSIGIALGATPYTTIGATTDGPAHALCNVFGSNQVVNDIWFNFPSQCNGLLGVNTCAAQNYDSRIAVYANEGNCAAINDQTLLACDDDACNPSSSVTVPVLSGHTYAIRVGGYNGVSASGAGTLQLTCFPLGYPGDINCDNVVNLADMPFFITALINPAAFAGCNINRADLNGDTFVNGRDIRIFVDIILAP